MSRILKYLIIFLVVVTRANNVFALPFGKEGKDPAPLFSFSTGGYQIYHLKPATINNSGSRVIVSAAFDGTVLCHSRQGELIWKNNLNKDFPFDLAVEDINNDGFDEIFIATAGCRVYAFNPDGSHLWTYASLAELYQVCPVKLSGGEWRIFTGGIEEKIDCLSSAGVLLSSIEAGNVVRHIRKGNILGDGNEYVAVATTSSGLTGNLALILLNPVTLTQVWKKTGLGVQTSNSGRRFFSMIVDDIDKNGKDNIVVSASWGDNGLLYGFDETGIQMITNSTSTSVPRMPYRMNLLSSIDFKNTDEDYIFGIFANLLIIYNANGSYNSILTCKYDFSNGAFDPESNTYYIGSSPSGGDGIYAFNLDHPDWKTAFQQIKPVGRLAEVENNLALLTQQVNTFVKPSYQPGPENVVIFTTKIPAGTAPANLLYSSSKLTTQIVIPGELWCKNLDSRYLYDQTSEQILAYARQQEASKQNFALWGGHGKAVYMRPSTMEAVLLEAPVYFKGFIFAEMEQIDSDMQRVVNEIILPLAQKCSAAGKKIIFRNKSTFWSATCYLDFWRNVLFDPRFHDVFVPSLEETGNRTQELSLAGRVGLWMTGSFDQWSARPVTDNACFDRMWEWSSQQVMSHYIRKMAMRASLGADIFQVDIHQASLSESLHLQLQTFYDMLAKGIIAIPKREEVLSVSDLCLGMKAPPSQFYIDRGINGHKYDFPNTPQTPMVFDRLDCYWGAAPIPEHDFSSYGYGVERRMLNFLPVNPYGLVTIIPDNTDILKYSWLKEKITTDGMNFFNQGGAQQTPAGYKATVIEKLEAAASRLAVRVKGDAAWTVVRLDNGHVRVALFDPGYTDPASREAEIVIQHLEGIKAVDILSGVVLQITDQKILAGVPAGSMRIIDIEHTPTSVDNPESERNVSVYPNPSSGYFNIKGNNLSGNLTFIVYDLCGRIILTDRLFTSAGEFVKELIIKQKGIYIIRITGEKVNYSNKIIIQ